MPRWIPTDGLLVGIPTRNWEVLEGNRPEKRTLVSRIRTYVGLFVQNAVDGAVAEATKWMHLSNLLVN